MRRIFFLLLPLFLFVQLYAQDGYVATGSNFMYKSADTLNGKAKNTFTFGGFIKLNMIYDFVGLSNITALNIPEIPVGKQFKNPYISLDTYQTRLNYNSTHQTNIGEVKIRIVGDFWGSGSRTNFRMRQALISFRKWDIGHTFTTFADLDAWPIMNDWDGPPTGIWSRQAMIRYNQPFSTNSTLSIAAEAPLIDYNLKLDIDSNLTISNQTIPDIHVKYKLVKPNFRFQTAAVYRNIRYIVNADSSFMHQNGWGLMTSAYFHFERGDNLYVQLLAGQGIARYLVGFSGQNWDAVALGEDEIYLLPVAGGFIGYDHYWDKNKKFSSTFVIGTTVISNNFFHEFGNPLEGYWGLANFYWRPIPNLQFSVEYTYGYRKDHFLLEGDASRITFMAYYQF